MSLVVKPVFGGLYYPCSENKDADQLDLRLCFCICKKPGFSRRGSYYFNTSMQYTANVWGCKNVKTGNFQMKTCDIFIMLPQNIDLLGYSLEPPRPLKKIILK